MVNLLAIIFIIANWSSLHFKMSLDQKDREESRDSVAQYKIMIKSERVSSDNSKVQLKVDSSELSLPSSSFVSSNYARYLSHLSIEEEEEEGDEKALYWDITSKCLLYLKREEVNLNTDIHDQLIAHIFSHHFDLTKIDPTPISSFGKWLLQNGYFLAAYALYNSRLRKSTSILKYYASLYSKYDILIGESQMNWYIKQQYGDKLQSNKRQGPDHEKPIIRTAIDYGAMTQKKQK